MKKLFLVLSLIGSSVYAQGNVTPEASNEIKRRGNHVEVIDGIQGDDPVTEVTSPPQDDSHKWYLTVVTTNGCTHCERLKYDFANAPNLQCWVDVDEHEKSFMHYNVFRIEDKTQAWRWKEITFKGFPTIIIQPPRNGKYGDHRTVVCQLTGYDGNSKKLSQTIRDRLVNYVNHLQRAKTKVTGFEQSEKPAFEQRQPMPDFLPQEPDLVVPPELEGEVPMNHNGFTRVWEGFKDIGGGFWDMTFGGGTSFQTVLLLILVFLVFYQMKNGVTKTEKKE